MTLLVATQNPNATAETYVRRHMEGIYPDRTVGLSFALEGDCPSTLPFISVLPPENFLLRKIYLVMGRILAGFSGAPVGKRRRAVIKFLKHHRVSVVLAEFGPTGAALREVCKSEGIPLVVNFHGYDATVMPQRASVRMAYKLLARDASGFVCGSKHFRETVCSLGIRKDQVVIIPCGVQLEKFALSQQTRSAVKLIAVGRLTAKKAPIKTLQAFALARNQSQENLVLEIIGDGPMMAECREFVRINRLGQTVTLRGACAHEEVIRALATADIFVQHSVTAPNGDTESQGISLIEAMASSLPVVATDHNGFAETVVDGITGFLVAEGDIDGMANRISTLASDKSLREAFGSAGRERAENLFDEQQLLVRLKEHLLSFVKE